MVLGTLTHGVATVQIEDPDVHRTNAPVDQRGRVSIGRELAGETVTIVVETTDNE